MRVAQTTAESILDVVVARAHTVTIRGRKVHPYFIASDLAALAALIVALTVLGEFPGIAGTQFALVFVGMFVYYRGALAMKARWLAMPSRSFLQDTLFILLPMYGLVVWTLHYPRALAFDVVGVLLPAYIAVVRIGCFLGGCCYGVPSRYGVLYPREIFTPVDGCRRFRPGPVPNGRVLPVQLVESAGAALLFVFLFAWLTRQPTPPGTALPRFLLGYCSFRVVLDFWRTSSARPHIGRWTEAQILCVVTSSFCVIWLAVH
jgi:phosphatidylglycerol:prolipoprotein diacylglycerol transferase